MTNFIPHFKSLVFCYLQGLTFLFWRIFVSDWELKSRLLMLYYIIVYKCTWAASVNAFSPHWCEMASSSSIPFQIRTSPSEPHVSIYLKIKHLKLQVGKNNKKLQHKQFLLKEYYQTNFLSINNSDIAVFN